MIRRLCALVAALGLFGTGCGVFGGGDTYELTAFFPRAVALYEDGEVRVLGLPAGTIEEIAADGDRVRVRMSIDSDIPIPEDVHATIIPQSLIGERYVQLMPAWTRGEPRAPDGHVIELEDTIVPVEPDEALEALDEFINSLDPDGLGRLIGNLSESLDGNGQTLNSALENLSGLVETIADKDQELVSIVESFDQFTQTLRTREQQLGEVLDAFAAATQVLADEREGLERLIGSLASLSENGLDLIADNAVELRGNIETLARLAQSLVANLDSVAQLIDSGPLLTSGLLSTEQGGAYNAERRAINLRNNLTPLLSSYLSLLLGIPVPCIDLGGLLGTVCEENVAGLSAAEPVPLDVQRGTPSPVGAIVGLLGAPTVPGAAVESPSIASQIAEGASSVGRFLAGSAGSLVGVSE